MKKNVLLIAYLFPPIGGGGVQRALTMAKYLQQYDCNVCVLTVKNPRHVSLDTSLLKEVGDIPIYRAREKTIPGMTAMAEKASVVTKKGAEQDHEIVVPLHRRLLQKVKPFLRTVKESVLVPDDEILWYREAVKLGKEIIRREKVDVIFSTSGPYTNHLVGKKLKEKTGVKWIADFRDPWTQNMHRPTQKWRLQREEKMEREVMTKADLITTVTHSFAHNFKKKYGDDMAPLEVIHNGYDPAHYVDLEAETLHPDKCTFIYTGIFYAERNPRLFLSAVAELIEEGKVDRNDVSLQFAGVFDYPGYSDNIDHVQKLQLEDIVHIWGNLPHKRALSLLAGADQLLLVGDMTADSGAYIPGKLYEYMAVKKPIFALTVDGESARIIEKHELGKVISPFHKEEIKAQFLHVYEHWKKKQPVELKQSDTRMYERDEQARLLSELIHQL